MQTVTQRAPWAMNSNNPHGFYKVGVFDQLTITHGFRQWTVCVRPPCTNVSTQRTVCDIHTYGNVFLGFTMWDVHTYGNDFLGFTVWDVHTYGNDFWDSPCGMYISTEMVGFPCLARSHTAPAWVPRGPIPDDFWVVWEGPPYRPHSLGDGSKCRRGKGLKTVCLGPTRTSGNLFTHRNNFYLERSL